MQELVPDGAEYTEAEIRAALVGAAGTRALTFRYEVVSGYGGEVTGEIETLVEASVSYNALADIKRTARFVIHEPVEIDWGFDRIKPWVGLRMPDGGIVEWAQGVFVLSTPTRTLDGGVVVREVEAYDLAKIMADDVVGSRYTILAGTPYADVIGVLRPEGMLMHFVDVPPGNLAKTMEWETGTSRLAVTNDLLAAINFQPVQFNAHGVLEIRKYVDTDEREAEWDFATDERSIIRGNPTETLDLYSVPNKWVVSRSDPDGPELVGRYTNTNPASPTSVPSRGRTIVDFRTDDESPNQATINAKAKRYGKEASQVYGSIEFETAILPIAGHADTYSVEIDGLGVDEIFTEQTWAFDLKAGAAMKHKARRVVSA